MRRPTTLERRFALLGPALGLGLLVGLASTVTAGIADATEVVRYGLTQATLAWSPPSTGIVAGYAVMVARNGQPERAERVVVDPTVTLTAQYGDTPVVRVRAIGQDRPGGSPTMSAPSLPRP